MNGALSPQHRQSPQQCPGIGDYLGLFLIALATLMLEILLTRIFSVTLWYHLAFVAVVYKTTALATVALQDFGVTDTRRHIVVVAQLHRRPDMATSPGVGTLLVKRTPFTDADLARLAKAAADMDFDIVLSPATATTPAFADVADAARLGPFLDASTLNLSPPDDDRPFFFNLNADLLNGLLAFVFAIASGLIILPVLLKADVRAIRREGSLSLAFVAFGLGFMLIEIALMMRLTLLLGHPTFSLSVVLFGMLLASGAGSVSTARLEARPWLRPRGRACWRLSPCSSCWGSRRLL